MVSDRVFKSFRILPFEWRNFENHHRERSAWAFGILSFVNVGLYLSILEIISRIAFETFIILFRKEFSKLAEPNTPKFNFGIAQASTSLVWLDLNMTLTQNQADF